METLYNPFENNAEKLRLDGHPTFKDIRELFELTIAYYPHDEIDPRIYDIWHEDWRCIARKYTLWEFEMASIRIRMKHGHVPVPYYLEKECALVRKLADDFSSGKMKFDDE